MKTSNLLIITILITGLGFMLGNSFKPSKSETLAVLFSYPDGSTCYKPCIVGIQPGFTTPNQAIELLKTHPFTKGNVIRQSQFNNQDYLNTELENNYLMVRLDYETNQVLEVNLISSGIDGVGSTGIEIEGIVTTWRDILSFLGSPKTVTASAGDGGMIKLAAGLYDEGWCIHAEPDNDFSPTIPLDGKIIRIEINCSTLRDLGYIK